MIGRRYRHWVGLLVLTGLMAHAGSPPLLLRVRGGDIAVDPSREGELRKLIDIANGQIRRWIEQEKRLDDERERLLASRAFTDMSYPELKRYFSEPRHFISDKDRRGWKELQRLATTALNNTNLDARQECFWAMREVAAAMRNNHRSPSPPHMDILQPPLYYMDYAHNPIGKGERPAYNLRRGDGGDLSKLDPLPSTFWSRPNSISELDLFYGFGRRRLPDFESLFWNYAGPKTSYGGCPGFDAEANGVRIKVKFGETTSEPFTARIFWALGYNVEPTDYAHALKIKYDRRLLREFHLRKDVEMKARALMITVYRVKLQQRYDPFDYIYEAVLKNGSRMRGDEFKSRLLRNLEIEYPEDTPGNFDTEFERQIDYLVTTPANVQIRDSALKSIGPWDFQSLDHADRREVRAAGLLGAWVGWFDSRFENTRVKIVERDGTNAIRHYFTDLGGGLGKAKGVLSRHCECPNDFGWRFTRPPKAQGKGKMTIPFRIIDYQPIEDTEAFRQMTVDDARWMARLLGQLSEKQLVAALVASGFDATEVRIYTEKLISRRDWMVRDLGLADEVALLRPDGTSANVSYAPDADLRPAVELSGGHKVHARESSLLLQDGVVWPQLHTRTPRQRIQFPVDCPLHEAAVR